MARYRGPKSKIARKFNDPIFGPSKALQKKAYPPGQHGRGRRKKQSEYSVQLQAKQKAKYTYGVLERQFRNLFERAARKSGVTGENLLMLLESRLDNVVYRLGIANTRRMGRQLVSHKHITVNGEILNIPSYSVKVGDVISIKAASIEIDGIQESLSRANVSEFPWLEWDSATTSGKVVAEPSRDEIPEQIQEQLIVELYSK